MFALSCPLSLMSYNCRIQWPRVEGPPPPLSPHPGHSPGQGTRNLQCRDAFSPNPYYPSGGMVFDIALSIRECRFPVKPRPGRGSHGSFHPFDLQWLLPRIMQPSLNRDIIIICLTWPTPKLPDLETISNSQM